MSLTQDLRLENTDHTENCCAACVSERRRAAAEIERLTGDLIDAQNALGAISNTADAHFRAVNARRGGNDTSAPREELDG